MNDETVIEEPVPAEPEPVPEDEPEEPQTEGAKYDGGPIPKKN